MCLSIVYPHSRARCNWWSYYCYHFFKFVYSFPTQYWLNVVFIRQWDSSDSWLIAHFIFACFTRILTHRKLNLNVHIKEMFVNFSPCHSNNNEKKNITDCVCRQWVSDYCKLTITGFAYWVVSKENHSIQSNCKNCRLDMPHARSITRAQKHIRPMSIKSWGNAVAVVVYLSQLLISHQK